MGSLEEKLATSTRITKQISHSHTNNAVAKQLLNTIMFYATDARSYAPFLCMQIRYARQASYAVTGAGYLYIMGTHFTLSRLSKRFISFPFSCWRLSCIL